ALSARRVLHAGARLHRPAYAGPCRPHTLARRILSEESLSSPSPNPALSSSKTFVFIESLFRVFNMLKDEALFFFRPQ
ncbi:hypothetical protein, partial [Bilophila wadsworthia]|uniref:hypothetical protein n=1 Tax=Bilophila wadsworthia TaxID=35833 RepID=UPI0032BF59EE